MNNIEHRLARIETLLTIGMKEVLNVKEAAALIDRSESRVLHLMSDRQIPYYKNDRGQISFLKSELEAWTLGTKVPTAEELESQAQTHIAISRLKSSRI